MNCFINTPTFAQLSAQDLGAGLWEQAGVKADHAEILGTGECPAVASAEMFSNLVKRLSYCDVGQRNTQ